MNTLTLPGKVEHLQRALEHLRLIEQKLSAES